MHCRIKNKTKNPPLSGGIDFSETYISSVEWWGSPKCEQRVGQHSIINISTTATKSQDLVIFFFSN